MYSYLISSNSNFNVNNDKIHKVFKIKYHLILTNKTPIIYINVDDCNIKSVSILHSICLSEYKESANTKDK